MQLEQSDHIWHVKCRPWHNRESDAWRIGAWSNLHTVTFHTQNILTSHNYSIINQIRSMQIQFKSGDYRDAPTLLFSRSIFDFRSEATKTKRHRLDIDVRSTFMSCSMTIKVTHRACTETHYLTLHTKHYKYFLWLRRPTLYDLKARADDTRWYIRMHFMRQSGCKYM